jgi:hypothetical protein
MGRSRTATAPAVRERRLPPAEAEAAFNEELGDEPEGEDASQEPAGGPPAGAPAGDDEDDDAPAAGGPGDGNVDESNLPEWAGIPPGMKVPVGVDIVAMRFRAKMTRAPHKGDRVLVCWTLSDYEESEAYKRSRGDNQRSLRELAKATIRVVDGMPADRSGKPSSANVSTLWNEIGPRCRQQVVAAYIRTHTMGAEDYADFFANCYAQARSSPT